MNTDAITVTVNGEGHQLSKPASISDILSWLRLPADRVAVELDKILIRKRDWPLTEVSDGSRLEIVEFVGGG